MDPLFTVVEVKISFSLPIFINITETVKYFKSLYGFGGRRLKIRDVFMDL